MTTSMNPEELVFEMIFTLRLIKKSNLAVQVNGESMNQLYLQHYVYLKPGFSHCNNVSVR